MDRQKKKQYRNAKSENIDLVMSKVPPQAVDLEEVVLGAMMLDKDVLGPVIEILSEPEYFYKDEHQHIFKAIKDLYGRFYPVDILTVTQQLRQNGAIGYAGGAYYITQLTNRVASGANVEHHSRIILQKYMLRKLITLCHSGLTMAYEETSDVLELFQQVENELFGISHGVVKKSAEDIVSLVTKVIKQVEVAHTKTGVINVPSGFTELDRVTGGWAKTDLIIIAGRPGMGKTSFAMTMAKNVAIRFNKPVAVFSLEMSSLQLVNRLVSQETKISTEKLKQGNLTDPEWMRLSVDVTGLTKSKIFVDDTAALNVFELKAKARRMISEHKVELILVDYLQLMSAGTGDNRGGNREGEISTISRTLKAIAKELDVPIIALSQLSRAVESRGGSKRPQLSDLRESGAIEQDADMVLFVYRPEYYGLTEDENMSSTAGLAEIIIAKNRHGALKTINLKFEGEFTMFSEFGFIEEEKAPEPPRPVTIQNPKALEKPPGSADDDIPY